MDQTTDSERAQRVDHEEVRTLRARGALLLIVIATTTIVPIATSTTLGPLGAAPAHATTSYTWKGTDSSSWGTPKNWDPEGVPQNGDAVALGPVGSSGVATITGVPDVSLSTLTVSGDPEEAVSMSGDGSVLVGNLQWSGGDISVDLTVSSPPLDPMPSVISPGQTPLRFGYGGGQTLTLLSDVEIPVGLGAGTEPWLTFMFDSSLRIAGTATLRLDPAAHLAANRCCTAPTSTVVVDGTLEVFSIIGATGYTARLDQLGLDLAGVVAVPAGNTLEVTGGPVRVGSTPLNHTLGEASLRGGGTLSVVETDGGAFDAAHPHEPDTTMKFLDVGEKLTLAGSTTLALGDFATVSGVGTITGNGSVRLAGVDVRGELVLDDNVSASTVSGTDSRVVYRDAVRGQHGVLTPRGGLDVVPGSTLTVNSGTRVIVPDGARLDARAGSVVSSSSCCNDPARLTVQRGGTLAVGAGSGAPTVLRWLELGGAGAVTHTGRSSWDLAGTTFTSGATLTGDGTIDGDLPAGALTVVPTRVLKVTGDYTPDAGGTYVVEVPGVGATFPVARLEVAGTAALAGRIETRDDSTYAAGRSLTVLKAGTVTGRFRCAVTPGLLPRYAARSVSVLGIGAKVPGCLVASTGRVLKARFKGRRTAPVGVPAEATFALLHVKLGRAPAPHAVTVSGGRAPRTTVSAGAGKSAQEYVVVRLAAAGRLVARSTRRASVTVTRVGWS